MPKILAVDDSATMRRIYEMTFVGQPGVEIVTAESSEQALRSASGVDLILADASMSPSGYELARTLRESGHPAPVLLLASQHAPFDAEQARAAGIEDHLLKPFDTQSLLDKARDVMARARGGEVLAVPVAAAPAAGLPRGFTPTPVVAVPSVPSSSGSRPGVGRTTASFGAPVPRPVTAVPPSAIVAGASAPGPAAVEKPAGAASAPVVAAVGEMAVQLSGMGLTPAQVEGILALSREVVERVVWEVVPEVAERLVREEIKRLTA